MCHFVQRLGDLESIQASIEFSRLVVEVDEYVVGLRGVVLGLLASNDGTFLELLCLALSPGMLAGRSLI